MSDKDDIIRKQVCFNRKSPWHMKIFKRMEKESNNFSGYTMSILKSYFDERPEIEEKKKEQPIEATQITVRSEGIKLQQ
ncbi:hypothetical protein [Microcystis phage MaeS]|nr:hypothetical protein [Microcystis phage MaeS]